MESLHVNSLLLNELSKIGFYRDVKLKFPHYFFMRMNFATG